MNSRVSLIAVLLGFPFLAANSWATDPCWCQTSQFSAYHHNPVGAGISNTCGQSSIKTISVDGGAPAYCTQNGDMSPDYTCPVSPTLAEGQHQIVLACDGNPSPGYYSSTSNFTVDDTSPQLSISTPTEGAVFLPSTVTVTGTVTDNFAVGEVVVLVVGDNTYVASLSTTSTWSLAINRSSSTSATVTVKVQARDAAWNYKNYDFTDSTLQRTFYIDGLAPSVSISSPVSGSVITTFTAITGTASDNKGLKEVKLEIRENSSGKYWNGSAFVAASTPIALPASQVSGLSSTWTYTGLTNSVLTVGTSYYVKALAEDLVGNRNDFTDGNIFVFDPCNGVAEPGSPRPDPNLSWSFEKAVALFHPIKGPCNGLACFKFFRNQGHTGIFMNSDSKYVDKIPGGVESFKQIITPPGAPFPDISATDAKHVIIEGTFPSSKLQSFESFMPAGSVGN